MGNMYILLSGLIGTILSLIVTLSINIFFQKRYFEKSLAETRMKLNELMLKEPFLRTEDFFKELLTDDKNENNLRQIKFDLFCKMLYNYLKDICEYHKYSESEEILKKYNFKENIEGTIEWWMNKRKNGTIHYDDDFTEFINKYIENDPELSNICIQRSLI